MPAKLPPTKYSTMCSSKILSGSNPKTILSGTCLGMIQKCQPLLEVQSTRHSLIPGATHRWHSPVCGKIVKVFIKPGTYFSQTQAVGVDESGLSQGYMAQVATRAIIFIQADNPDIGLMVFLGVGMGEVSSCDITVTVGQHVKKGQKIGMFHYGGSTYCLIFGPHVKIEFDLHGQIPCMEATNLPVNSLLATVKHQ